MTRTNFPRLQTFKRQSVNFWTVLVFFEHKIFLMSALVGIIFLYIKKPCIKGPLRQIFRSLQVTQILVLFGTRVFPYSLYCYLSQIFILQCDFFMTKWIIIVTCKVKYYRCWSKRKKCECDSECDINIVYSFSYVFSLFYKMYFVYFAL